MLKGATKPRIFTPPLAPLEPRSPHTEARTFGYSAIDFAEHVCQVELTPWQKWLLVHGLERAEPNGHLRFKTIVVLAARQQGKSLLSQVLALWSMYVYPHLVDLSNRMTVLGTAQDLDTAEQVWEGALDLVEEIPDLAELADKPIKVNGRKAIRLLSGEQYKVKAANRKAGRGLSGDLIILDELREHQSWDAWGAVTKTTIARPLAQVWAFSNAGDVSSVVLRHLRKMAHKAIGDPDGICKADDAETGPTEVDVLEMIEDEGMDVQDFDQDSETLGLFEWSAKPGCGLWDREGWSQANPSLGYGLVTERTLAAACKTDPEWVFRTEVLCQWSDGTLEGPFPPGSWELGLNQVVEDADGKKSIAAGDRITSKVRACIDMSADRSMTYVAFAGYRDDGAPQVEIVAKRRGTDWLDEWFMDPKRRDRIVEVTGQLRGAPISDKVKALHEDPTFSIPVVEWSGGDLMAAHGITFDAVRDGVVRHNPQPLLDLPAATAVLKQLQEGFVINRMKSPVDAAPLVAFEGALWLLLRHAIEPPPPPAAPEALDRAEDADEDHSTYTDDLATLGF